VPNRLAEHASTHHTAGSGRTHGRQIGVC
jgi:hypothetical protein